jgi:hypothetical protein
VDEEVVVASYGDSDLKESPVAVRSDDDRDPVVLDCDPDGVAVGVEDVTDIDVTVIDVVSAG